MPFDAPALADVVEAVIRAALQPVTARLKALEGKASPDEMIATLRERVATLEALPTQPGPPGPPGADGLGFDSYTVDYDGERTFTHRWTAGEKTGERTFTAPIPIYRGVFLEEKVYERGDMVTVNGSVYHCDTDTTTRPGDGSKDWTLAVKRGKDDRGSTPWRK
jgi:hypothetical protein